jgi:hypothetical protein
LDTFNRPAGERQRAPGPEGSFALTGEQGRIEARAAFIAMVNMNSAAARWTDPGDMPGKIAVFAGGMIGERDWDRLAFALAGLFDAFARSSTRLASFIDRDARINAILATQLGMPFGASQESGSRAFQNGIPAFYRAFRDEFLWICRHAVAVEPGQEPVDASSIEQGVTGEAVSEWSGAFVLFDRAIVKANQ